MIKNSAMLGLALAFSVVTHLAVGFASKTYGYAEGYSNGVRDGHLAVRRAVNGQVEALCPKGMYDPNSRVDGRYCMGAMAVQNNLEQRAFPNAGRHDPYQGIEQYLVTPH